MDEIILTLGYNKENHMRESSVKQTALPSEATPVPEVLDDHWNDFARQMQRFMLRLTDKEVSNLYAKLVAENWRDPIFPMTKEPDAWLKQTVLETILAETVMRAEQTRMPAKK